jgi:hypothetical protein
MEYTMCHCGYVQSEHNFRHLFSPSYKIQRVESQPDFEGEVTHRYIIDANDFLRKENPVLCTVPQCGREKSLHGAIIRHEYVPGPVSRYREIDIVLPNPWYSSCCNSEFLDGKSHTANHTPIVRTTIRNKEQTDRVTIKTTDGRALTTY